MLDNLDRALATVPDAVSPLPWMDGLVLVDRQLRATLEKQGLKPSLRWASDSTRWCTKL